LESLARSRKAGALSFQNAGYAQIVIMRPLQHTASVLLLLTAWAHAAQMAGESDPLADAAELGTTAAGNQRGESFLDVERNLGSADIALLMPAHAVRTTDFDIQPEQDLTQNISANWRDVLARIDLEEEALAACRTSPDACSPATQRLLQIVEHGRQRVGRARLGEINRAVNLSIKAISDWVADAENVALFLDTAHLRFSGESQSN
jgi:hypothetical protein